MKSIPLVIFLFLYFNIAYGQSEEFISVPFSTNDSAITIWNGTEYVPFFLKGTNLGVSVPGTFPGELAAMRSDYSRWFREIKDAGFNCIRLYTLHYPRFYEVLDSFNMANLDNPLFVIHGVWLDEEREGYDHDLHFLNDAFQGEIEENVDCIHGNRVIPHRFGKAYGTYSVDVSQWCMAYIIGREVYPEEVFTTNNSHSTYTSFFGEHFTISNVDATETWFTTMLDHLVSYETQNYSTSRPVSISSWPTLDPLDHEEEPNQYEDTASVDLSGIEVLNAPAGFFVSYHAYPYYPDFVSLQSSYLDYYDDYGINSYLGYLTDLKSHYTNFPLVIAEFGVPSSWAIAHYATSGMNHGGFDEYSQGLTNIRMLESIYNTGCAGGIHFAWIDEWFKRTWLTDPLDYEPGNRVLWHNVAAAEQNYGLKFYHNTIYSDTLMELDNTQSITYLQGEVDYSFLKLEIGLKEPLQIPDELWVALDTYDQQLGEKLLPTSDTIPTRAEFALHITNYTAQLYVTQAYDIFGIWHGLSEPEQLYHSIPTDGAPWEIVRIRNNSYHSDVQYIGNLYINQSFQPTSSEDAITIHEDKIEIRIPWFYLNFVAPNQRTVLNDDRNTVLREDTITEGVGFAVFYDETWYSPIKRLVWPIWESLANTPMQETFKKSYYVLQENLPKFNTPAIAIRDSFIFEGPQFPVAIDAVDGLLKNDFDLDGDQRVAFIERNPENGHIELQNNGAFEYYPNPGFTGIDSIQYSLYDGFTLSQPNTAVFQILENDSVVGGQDNYLELMLNPNPVQDILRVSNTASIFYWQIFDTNGNLHRQENGNKEKELQIPTGSLSNGMYVLVTKTSDGFKAGKFIKK